MRSLITLLFVLVLCLAGIGLYRGWFSMSSPNPDAEGNKFNVTVSVDKNKIRSDIKKAKETVKQEIGELEGKVKAKEEKK